MSSVTDFRAAGATPLFSRFLATNLDNPGCWNWVGAKNRDGYGRTRIAGRIMSAHRSAYELLVGPVTKGALLCHTCDNPGCCNPRHIFEGTAADNYWDSRRKGRACIGEKSGVAKLTAQQAGAIRLDRRRIADISREYNISRTAIAAIKNGRSWKHLE